MISGPWYVVMRRGGYAVRAGDRTLIGEFTGPHLMLSEHRSVATACAALPEMIGALREAEAYFGDLPCSDKAALQLHSEIVRVLNAADISLKD
jgi:hypothetical protein